MHSHAHGAHKVAVMVNNLGGTSNLEMGIIMRAALAVCKAKGLVVERCVQGALMTSFQMAGKRKKGVKKS